MEFTQRWVAAGLAWGWAPPSLSCLHGHMCCRIDSPLTNPNNTSPPTGEPFSPPRAVHSQCVRVMGKSSPPPWPTPPASLPFPDPPGATREWPVATEARLKYPCGLPPFPPPFSNQYTSLNVSDGQHRLKYLTE